MAAEPEAETGVEDAREDEADAGTCSGSQEPSEAGEVPEMLDLIESAEEVGEDVAALVAVIRNIGRRIRATPGDRDLLSDFEGIVHICTALSKPPHSWRGEAMIALCQVAPDVCRSSVVNRGSLRDEGFVAASVDLLQAATAAGDEAAATAACIALTATCTANDGNKRVAARLLVGVDAAALPGGYPAPQEAPESETAGAGSNGLVLLLNALGRFVDSVPFQAEGIAALRTLLVNDDPRSRDGEAPPASQDNREVATSDAGFPFFGAAVEGALAMADEAAQPRVKLREQALLLLCEISRRQDRVEALALGAKLLKRVAAYVAAADSDPRIVRASFAVLRNFAVLEEARDEIAIMSDGALTCLAAVRKHLATPAVCEQGFGLFANLTMRKSPQIAARLNDGDNGVVVLGLAVLRAHPDRPDVMRSTIHTLRNVATQDDAGLQEIKESDVFDEVRGAVRKHEGDARWRAAVDIARQFLREFRADEGMEKKAQYNAFY